MKTNPSFSSVEKSPDGQNKGAPPGGAKGKIPKKR